MPLNNWDPDKATMAWNFANQCHAEIGQKVPGTDVPYSRHVGSVVMEIMSALHEETRGYNADLAVLCAILHDTIEDTNTNPEEIAAQFGQTVADGVMALSKKVHIAGKRIHGDYFERINAQPPEIAMVKMADRIVNLQPPPSHWNKEKRIAYQDEAQGILDAFRSASQVLATRLELKIKQYRV